MREYSPEERTEMLGRLMWMLSFRFYSWGLVLAVYFVVRDLVRIPLPSFPLLPIYIIIAFECFINQPYPFIARRVESLAALAYTHFVIDILVITCVIHYLGGINSLFCSLAYLPAIVFTGVVLSFRASLWMAGLSGLAYGGLVALEYYRIIPHLPVLDLNLKGLQQLFLVGLTIFIFYLCAYLYNYIIDLTKRRGAIPAEAYTEDIVRSISNLLFVLDEQGKFISINPATESALGYRMEEVVGESFTDFVQKDQKERVQSATRDALRDGYLKDLEIDLSTKQGEVLPVIINGFSMTLRKGRSTKMILVGRDMRQVRTLISDLERSMEESEERAEKLEVAYKELAETYHVLKDTQGQLIDKERELREYENRLTQSAKMAAVGQLAAEVAHDLNNPLSIVLMNIERVADKMAKPDAGLAELEACKKSIGRVTDASKRCKTIVADLLTFSRKEKFEFKSQPINRVVDDVLSLTKHRILLEGINLTTNYDPSEPNVWGDSDRLKQVFLNMVLNAINATPKDGIITVGTELLPEEQMVKVEFSNTGPPISEEVMKHLFKPFFTTREDGTGLGLAISQSIMKEHAGSIDVHSEEGKGATFVVKVPVGEKGG